MFGFDDFGLAWLCVVDIWDLWMFATRFGSMDTGAICLLVPDDQYMHVSQSGWGLIWRPSIARPSA